MDGPPDDDSTASRSLEPGNADTVDSLIREAAEALDGWPAAAAVDGAHPEGSGTQPDGLELAEGAIVGARYRLGQRLGEGGMGEVWAATHTVTRRSVALKFLKRSLSGRSDLRARFLRESRAASLVRHPCVVEVFDVFELDDGMPVMVMELLIGETLGDKLAREGVLPVAETVGLVLSAVEAVEAAHARGIVHRDLKPDNIFLERRRSDAGSVSVKVLDFGIAKLTATEGDAQETGSLTRTGSVLGTPWYMAPEQLWGDENIDARADIWALGVILYQCLAGRRPLQGANVGQLVTEMHGGGIVPIEERVPGLDPEFARLVGQMLSRERERRPTDLAVVRSLLARPAAREASTPRPDVEAREAVDRQRSRPAAGAHEEPAKDASVPSAVPMRHWGPSSPRVLAGLALAIGGLAGWLLHSSSKVASEVRMSDAAPSATTSDVSPAAPRTPAAAREPVPPMAPSVSSLAGPPAATESSRLPSPLRSDTPTPARAPSRATRSAAAAVVTAPRTAARPEAPAVPSAFAAPSEVPRGEKERTGLIDTVPF
jgi:serine/threonine protein kinase